MAFAKCQFGFTIISPVLLILLLLAVPIADGSKFIDKYTNSKLEVRLDRRIADTTPANTFNLKYRLLDVFHTDVNNGPILVVICGQTFLAECMKTKADLMEDIAPRLNAAILFIEHRFYGTSYQGQEQGDTSVFNNVEKLRNLRVVEVLEDVREVLNGIGAQVMGTNPMQRAVLIGDDYAGALALWMGIQNQKDTKKDRPKFIWAASPSPLAISPEAPLSPKFDHQLIEILKQFGCTPTMVQPVFQFMKDKGLEEVKTALNYEGPEDAETVKDNVLEVLRMTMAKKNIPHVDEKAKKYIWPIEELCANLKKAANDTAKAHAFGAFMNVQWGNGLTKFNYQDVIRERLFDTALIAKNFQRCTELPDDRCAAGVPNDPFFPQCLAPQGQNYIKVKCQRKWLNTLKNYNPDGANSKYQPEFIKTTFGFDFSKLANVLVTGNQFDQYAQAFKFPASDPKRNFFAFPSIGLSIRGRELSVPSTCDPMSLSEFRTQVVDILLCLFHGHSPSCAQSKKWPAALSPENRADDAKRHVKSCKPLHWQFPWAAYPHVNPGPHPTPKPPHSGSVKATLGMSNLALYVGAMLMAAVAFLWT